MSFDYCKEYAKFKSDWDNQESIMRTGGMSEDSISELYRFSYEQFKADRAYGRKICNFTQIDQDDELLNKKKIKKGMVPLPDEFDAPLNKLMQSDNKKLLEGLNELTPSELQIIVLYCENGMDLKQISSILRQKYDTTQKQFYRAKTKIKNFIKIL